MTDDCRMGRSHKWHYKYSKPYTIVLGFVACRVCSKVLGIGMAERAWGSLKIIKDGRRSHMNGTSTEMRSIVYTNARLEQQRILREENERIDTERENNMFGDDDLVQVLDIIYSYNIFFLSRQTNTFLFDLCPGS